MVGHTLEIDGNKTVSLHFVHFLIYSTILILCLQRMMKPVSWMACWRHCSLVLRSRGREDHGKQVVTETMSKSTRMCPANVVCSLKIRLRRITEESYFVQCQPDFKWFKLRRIFLKNHIFRQHMLLF